MFLKSLTLKGFKSFADATTLEFEPGVTVVVGPNGSGKSNVVDAVAWVLGAQGPRTLRSSKMEDVIFAGTPKRPALGRAEVSLTIDNSTGRLPIEFSEVTITRTLFRTGESEYAINKVPCRLLDVQDLLSDSGVGRQQHVIISQGNIDAILSSRPEERRLVIEEAAGVLKYRRRKERAERRLESTEASLVRLQDLLREVRRQLRPLQRQAEAARRHGDLVAELTSLRRHLAGLELVEIEGRLEAAGRTRSELAGAETQLRAALGNLDTEVEAADSAVAEARARDDAVDLAEAVSRAEGARARAQGLSAVISERQRSLERELAVQVDADVIASLESEAAELGRALEATDAEAAELLPHEREVTEAEEVLAAETVEVERQWAEPAGPVTDPAAEVRAELGALRTSLDRDRTELRRLEGRDASLRQRVARLAAEHARLGEVVAESEASEAALRAEVDETSAVLLAAERAAADADEAQRTADAEHHRSVARTETLSQALDEARARAGAERLAEVEGVVGTLLELVEVDEGWEAAFEAAAGEVIAAVVVDGPDTARRSLDHLRSLGASGAVVALPDPGDNSSRKIWAGADPRALPTAPQALGHHVRARLPAVAAFLTDLLASAVVVDGGWAEAVDLAAERPDLVVVTRAGDRCAGGIWRLGAGGAGVTGAALDEAHRRCEMAAALVETTAEQARRTRTDREAAQSAHAQARSLAEANLSRQRAAADALRRVDSELGDARHDAE
ncbi:MAG: AAA family ATPase, partial [Acidimicrobiaceae bacterium]|nr:AAA family ATPase [Acidimicrobiaceae bacterium]